jgi:hypothetical protein
MITFQPLELQNETITQMMQDFYTIDNYPINLEFQNYFKIHFKWKAWEIWLIYDDSESRLYWLFIFSFEYGGKIAFLDELYINRSRKRNR